MSVAFPLDVSAGHVLRSTSLARSVRRGGAGQMLLAVGPRPQAGLAALSHP